MLIEDIKAVSLEGTDQKLHSLFQLEEDRVREILDTVQEKVNETEGTLPDGINIGLQEVVKTPNEAAFLLVWVGMNIA